MYYKFWRIFQTSGLFELKETRYFSDLFELKRNIVTKFI